MILTALMTGCGGQSEEEIKKAVERIENVAGKTDEQKYMDLYVTGLLWENKDIKTAESYYLAAVKYKKSAYADIGRMYYRKVSKKKGKEKYREGWEKGDSESAYELGIIYDQYEKSPDEGEKWLKLAGESGHAGAQFNLGAIYGDKEEIIESMNWYKKSAEQGDKEAQYNLAKLYKERNIIKEAEYWYEKAANQGLVEAQNNLGNLYADRKKYEKAEYWYNEAIKQGDQDALFNLGLMYEEDIKDIDKAFYYYEKAAENGHLRAEEMKEKIKRMRKNDK